MSTLRLAMRWVASTSAKVNVGSSPSGTMATMMPIAKMKAFQKGMPIIRPSEKNETPISTARIAVKRLKCAISFRSGETSSAAVCVRCAILPISVCMPVAKTTALACPDTIDVPASTTFLLSIKSSAVDAVASRDFGQRFARDGGVIDSHAKRLDQPAVRGDVIARLQVDDIPWHQFLRRHPADLALAQYLGLLRQQFAQRRERLFDAILLPEREQSAYQDHDDNGVAHFRHVLAGIAPISEESQSRGNPQDQRKEGDEFLDEAQPQRSAGHFLHPVAAVFMQPALDFGAAQTVRGALQARDGIERQTVGGFS